MTLLTAQSGQPSLPEGERGLLTAFLLLEAGFAAEGNADIAAFLDSGLASAALRRLRSGEDQGGSETLGSLIPWFSEWSYHDGDAPQESSWFMPGFTPAGPGWKTGLSPFVVGDDRESEATPLLLGGMTYYFRHRFTISAEQLARLRQPVLEYSRDDGVAFHLNGVEVMRDSNLPADGVLDHETGALRALNGLEEEELKTFSLDVGTLREGENLLAAEVHQFNRESSDVYFKARLLELSDVERAMDAPALLASLDAGAIEEAITAIDPGTPHALLLPTIQSLQIAFLRDLPPTLQSFGDGNPHLWMVRARVQKALRNPGGALEATDRALSLLVENADPRVAAQAYEAGTLLSDPSPEVSALARQWVERELKTRGALRINCGADASMVIEDKIWGSDLFSIGATGRFGGAYDHYGQHHLGSIRDAGALDPVFRSERWITANQPTPAGYRIPLPNGAYRVTLHFAEIFPGNARAQGRIFNVSAEGQPVLDHFALYNDHGWATAVSRSFDTRVEDGTLDILFESVLHDSKVNGIEVAPLP